MNRLALKIVVTLATVGFLVACGSKKDDGGAVNVETAAPPTTVPQTDVLSDNSLQDDETGSTYTEDTENDVKGDLQAEPEVKKLGLNLDKTQRQLMKRIGSVDAAQQKVNKAWAKKIETVRSEVSVKTGFVRIQLEINEGQKQVSKVELAGVLSLNDLTAELTTQSGRPMRAQLACLDESFDSCQTAWLRLEPNSSAVVNIIVRTSKAAAHLVLPDVPSKSFEYRQFYAMFFNVQNAENNTLKLKTVNLNSYEVMGGKSGFIARMTTHNGELLVFKSAMNAKSGSAVDTKIMKEELVSNQGFNYSTNIMKTLRNVVVEENDGMSNLSISAWIKSKDRTKTEDQILIEFSRDLETVRDIPTNPNLTPLDMKAHE